MSKKNVSKKDTKKKDVEMRYGVSIPNWQIVEQNRFVIIAQEYDRHSASVIFLPKKIDSLIRKIEKLGVHVVDIETGDSKYKIRFIEDDINSGGADLLYDIYVNNPPEHVFFIWSERYSDYPKSFDLVINIAGEIVHPTIEIISKFGLLNNLMDTYSELKMCSKYVDIVLDAIEKGKKSKLKKLYQNKG